MEKLLQAIAEGNYKLKISNILTRGKYTASVLALRLQYIGMCMIQEEMYEEAPDGFLVRLSAQQIISLFGDKSKHIYEQLRDAADELSACEIGYIAPDTRRFDYLPLYSHVSYNKGSFVMIFNKEIESFLLQLRNKYCLLKSDVMMSLKSAYAYKLYAYLRSNCYKKAYEPTDPGSNQYSFVVNISELKYEMGVFDASNEKVVDILRSTLHPNFEKAEKIANENKYVNWSHFRICLAKMVREINNCEGSDIEISYKKKGHSNYICFVVTLKDQKTVTTDDVAETKKTVVITETAKMLSAYSVTPNGIKCVASEAKYNMDAIRTAFEVMQRSKHVLNPVGFMRIAIRKSMKPNNNRVAIPVKNEWERNYSSEFYRKLEQEAAVII